MVGGSTATERMQRYASTYATRSRGAERLECGRGKEGSEDAVKNKLRGCRSREEFCKARREGEREEVRLREVGREAEEEEEEEKKTPCRWGS
jgi:hypothetical protein